MTDDSGPMPLAIDDDLRTRASPAPHRRIDWTDEAQALLETEWARGTSARRIAEMLVALGYPVTRNSVLGRANRQGLGLHKDAAWTKESLMRRTPRRLLPADKPGRKPKAEGCRFIKGDPRGVDTVWCDAPRVDGKPYCAPHCRVCYVGASAEAPRTSVAISPPGVRGRA